MTMRTVSSPLGVPATARAGCVRKSAAPRRGDSVARPAEMMSAATSDDLGGAGDDRHRRAGVGEGPGDSLTDAAAAAGDQRDLAGEGEGVAVAHVLIVTAHCHACLGTGSLRS